MVKFAAILIGLTLAFSAHAVPKKSGKILGHRVVMTYSDFKKLPPKVQKKYLAEVQRIFYEWEKTMARFYPVVENKIQIPLFFETAEAAWSGTKCFVGGIDTGLVGGKCPTRVSRCDASAGITDSFKCGPIFGGVCIERNDIKDLSERCYTKAKGEGIKPAKEVLEAAERLKNEICKDGNEDIDGCQVLIRQWTEAKAAAEREAAATPTPGETPTGTTTGGAVPPPSTGRPPRTEDPLDPATRSAVSPTSDTSCYEPTDVKKCTPGAISLSSFDGKINLFQCVKHDANQPEAYRYRADALRFKRFIEENRTNPLVINGLAAFDTDVINGIAKLTQIIREGSPVFEFGHRITPQQVPAAKAMLEYYNKTQNLCETILKNRAESSIADTRNSAQKPLNLDELKNMAEWNEDYKQKFEEACKTTDKVPQTKAAQIFFMEGTPPVEKVWDTGFPISVKTGEGIFTGYQEFTFRRGVYNETWPLKKNPANGKYFLKRKVPREPWEGGDDGGEAWDDLEVDLRSVHRDLVNFNRVPANATGDSTCDSFRPTTVTTPGATSSGQQ